MDCRDHRADSQPVTRRLRSLLSRHPAILATLAVVLVAASATAQNGATRRTEGVVFLRTTAPTAAADLRLGDFWIDTDSSPTALYVLTALTPTWTIVVGAGVAPSGDDQVLVSDSATAASWRALTDCDNAVTSKLLYDTATNAWSCGTDQTSGGGGGAPTDAEYWVATANATLSAERDLGLLTTGLVLNTVTASVGVPSTYAGHTCAASNWLRVLNASGAGTCSQPLFSDISGSVTDAQVPNTITVDLATTATTANAGDSATAFFSAGAIEVARGGTGAAPGADDQVLVSDSTVAATWRTLPSCSNATTEKLLYNITTNSWSCGTDQTGGGSSHALLSATHTDTTAATVVRGDIITGQAVTPFWKRLALGGADTFLRSDGTDLGYSTITLANNTAGNYVASNTTGLGLAGGAAGSEGANITISIDYGQTLAGNPALNAKECLFVTTGTSGGGFICEGTVANTNEQLWLFPALDGVDTTTFIPAGDSAGSALVALNAGFADSADIANEGDTATGFFGLGLLEVAIGGTGSAPGAGDQVLVSDSTVAATWRSIPTCNVTTQKTHYNTASNTWTCEADATGGAGSASAATTTVAVTSDGMHYSATVAATWAASGTSILCKPYGGGASTPTPESISVSGIEAITTSIVAGVSFDIMVRNPYGLEGTVEFRCVGV